MKQEDLSFTEASKKIALFLIINGILTIFFIHFLKDNITITKEYKEVNCYDKYDNIIENQVCVQTIEKVDESQLPLIYSLILLFIILLLFLQYIIFYN